MTHSPNDHRSAIKATLDALPPPLYIRAICKACPHPAECRDSPCLNDIARPSLQKNQHSRLMLPEQARAFEAALREGKSLRMITGSIKKYGNAICTPVKYDNHCEAYPLWGAEMKAMAAANALANNRLKGIPHKNGTHCKRGHELPTAPNCKANGRAYRRCTICHEEASRRGCVPGEEIIGKVMVQLLLKKSINSFTTGGDPGFILKHSNFAALRRAFPEIDRLARDVIKGATSRAQKARHQVDETEVMFPPAKTSRKPQTKPASSVELTFETINAAVPANLPPEMRNDVINDVWVAAKVGEIAVEDLSACVKRFITSYNKMFPTKYAKFGNAPLVSLDATIFDDGNMTRGDTVSEGLWA